MRNAAIVCLTITLGVCAASAEPQDNDVRNVIQNRFDLLAEVVGSCPLDGQYETTLLMWRMWEKLTAKDDTDLARTEELIAETDEALTDLLRTLPSAAAAWDGVTLQWRETPAPLEVTVGLTRYLLLHIENRHGEPAQISTTPRRPRPAPARLTAIPAGAARYRLVPVLAASDDTSKATLTLYADGKEVTLPLPVETMPPARVTGRVLNGETGAPFPGRVHLRGSDGIYRHAEAYADNQTVSQKQILLVVAAGRYYRLPFFYSDGTFAINVPPGNTEIRLERGFESPIVAEQVNLGAGETTTVELATSRAVDMAALGWVSGDTHVHWAKNWWNEDEDIDLLGVVQRAEDLRVVNNLTLRHKNPPRPEFINPAQYPMGPVPGHFGPDYKVVMGEEYRNEPFYGHLNFLNIKELIQPISTGDLMGKEALDWPLNRPAVEECYRQGGISTEAHGLAAESAANIIDGLASAIDQANPHDYYLVLNAGMRVALGNGSDHPARLAGYARTYVRQKDPTSYGEWIQGVRDARTFTTSGPLLFLDVNGADIGDELRVSSGDTLRIAARAWSRFPIGRLQVVMDGKVLGTANIDGREGGIALEVPVARSGWVTARCSRTDMFSAIFEPDVAHTSAVYVVVDDQPIIRPAAARELARRLRHHAQFIQEQALFENDEQREQAMQVSLNAARAYEKRAEEGEAVYGTGR